MNQIHMAEIDEFSSLVEMDFFLLAMGFTGKKAIYFKQKYIEAFNEMEDVIRKNTVPQTIEDMMIYQLEEMKDVKKMFPCLKILCELADNKSLKLSKRKYESYGSSRGKKAELMKKSAKSILKILV